MGLENVSIPIAFGAGFLSFFSPCILPMIPAYIMYLTGSGAESEVKKRRLFALTRTMGFIIGFTIIFVIMGSSASFLGKIFIRNKYVFSKISGIIIIVFGLKMTGILNLKLLNLEKKVLSPVKITNWFSSVLMGIAFAAGWTPCFGPVLASILVYAGSSATVSSGVYLLLVYSIGMAVPFVLTALFINVFDKFVNKTQRFTKYIPMVSGIIMIIFGVLVFFNKVIVISGLFIR